VREASIRVMIWSLHLSRQRWQTFPYLPAFHSWEQRDQ